MAARADIVAARRLEPWLGREMASREQVERITLPPGSTFLEEKHPSRILTSRSEAGQRLGELYLEMLEKDADLAAFVSKRIELVTSLPRLLVPADSSPAAREVGDFVRVALAQVPSFGDNLEHQLNAIPLGLAIDEVVWEKVS